MVDTEQNGITERLIKGKEGSIWVVLLSTFVAVCGSFEYGTCIGYSAPTQSGIRDDIGLSVPEYAVFGSILTIGAMLGAVASGRIADFIGRKGAMRTSAAFCIVGWIAICFAKGAFWLDFGRFSTGFGIGILSYVVPVFIAEIAPKNLRGALTTLNQLMICGGISAAYIVGTIVTWRTLTLMGLIPCLIQLVGLFFIPESPRWLAKVGQKKEFEVALRVLRGKDADISQEAEEIQEYIETLQSLPKARIQDLFQRRYLHSVIVGVGLMVAQQFGGINGIAFYASDTFVSAGFSSGNLGTILMGSTQIPITALGAILMDKSGRRPLLMISASGTAVGCFLTGVSFYLKGQGMYMSWVPILALSGILVYLGSFSIGMGAVPWVIMSEIFPINIKGIAGSVVTLVNWFGSWAVSYTFTFLMSWSSPVLAERQRGMAIGEDMEGGVEGGQNDATEPLIHRKEYGSDNDDEGSIGAVLLTTSIAVCGSFVFGSCIGYSAPSQSGIRDDLGLSLSEYAVFGSILNTGAMIGAVTSGRIADLIGRKGAMRISAIICLIGWLAIYLAKVCHLN